MSTLLAINAVLHHPEIGYDANDHLLYMQTLPARLPTDEDTREFFSPPLPYFLPSLVDEACLTLSPQADGMACRYVAGKTGQIINLLLGIGTLFLLLKIADLWHPGNTMFKLTAMFTFGSLPVVYKTLAQFWGQPYVMFLSALAIWQFFKAIREPNTVSLRDAILLGVTLGLLILSRQWGFFLIATIIIFVVLLVIVSKDRQLPLRLARMGMITVTVSFLVGSWFYFYLYATQGSFTAFARPTKGFSFANKDANFYRGTGLKDLALFRAPVYGSFNDVFMPTFYSEMWGDYWGFFTLPNRTDYVLSIWDWTEADYYAAREYLGRVNLVSLAPSLLMGLGFSMSAWQGFRWIRARDTNPRTVFPAFTFLLIAISMLAYLWFVISYSDYDGDTIKASYVIHIFLPLALITANLLETIRVKKSNLFWFLGGLVLLIALHNLPAMITRYIYIP